MQEPIDPREEPLKDQPSETEPLAGQPAGELPEISENQDITWTEETEAGEAELTSAGENSGEPPRRKRPWLLILNLLMLAAIVVLFVLYFSKGKGGPQVYFMPKSSSGTQSIAFVNTDTIMEHYDFVKDMKKKLEEHTKALESEMGSKQKKFEAEAADFQNKVTSKAIDEQTAQGTYQQLSEKQQNLMALRDKYSQELAEQENIMNQQLVDTLHNFLIRFNRKYNLDYVLGFKKGGNIFYAKDTLDITKIVLDELNREYREKK